MIELTGFFFGFVIQTHNSINLPFPNLPINQSNQSVSQSVKIIFPYIFLFPSSYILFQFMIVTLAVLALSFFFMFVWSCFCIFGHRNFCSVLPSQNGLWNLTFLVSLVNFSDDGIKVMRVMSLGVGIRNSFEWSQELDLAELLISEKFGVRQ